MVYLENTKDSYEPLGVQVKDLSFDHVGMDGWDLFVNCEDGEFWLGECNERSLSFFTDFVILYIDEGEHSIVLEGWYEDDPHFYDTWAAQ